MPSTKEIPELVTCDCCVAEIRCLSATLPWHGYEKFVCPNGEDINFLDRDRPKYLTKKISGQASVSDCSGTADFKESNATQSWSIDPFTGLTSYSGPGTQNVSYLCSGGTSTCSTTQKQNTCTISVSGDPCAPKSETGKREVSYTETLSVAYMLSNVASRIDDAVSRIDINSIPDGAKGTVENGTGHSIVRITGTGKEDASWTEDGASVTKKYIYLKFKQDGPDTFPYKLYRKDLNTGVITVSDQVGSAGQEIKISASKLNEAAWVTTNSCVEFLGTNGATTREAGNKTYRESPNQCTPLIGPDCQPYYSSTYTETVTATDTGSGETLSPQNGKVELAGSKNFSYSKTCTIQTTACPSSSVENTSETESGQSGTTVPENIPPDIADYKKTVSDGVVTQTGRIKGTYGSGAAACECQEPITTPVYEEVPMGQTPKIIGSQTQTCTTTIGGATITTTSSFNMSTKTSGSPGSSQSSRTANSKVTTVWENPADVPNLKTISSEVNYTNTAWRQNGFNNNFYYDSVANVDKSYKITFTALQTNQSVAPFDPAIEYEVLLHRTTRTVNLEDPANPILTWVVNNAQSTVPSKGGPVEKSYDVNIPIPSTNHTVTYLTLAAYVWKKPTK